MAKTNFYKTGVLTIILSMAMSSTAFAATHKGFNPSSPASTQSISKTSKSINYSDINRVKTKINSLVKAGTITQAQEDAIVNLASANPDTGGINNIINAAFKAGTITEAQENALIATFIRTSSRNHGGFPSRK
jgi:hypothetical protein